MTVHGIHDDSQSSIMSLLCQGLSKINESDIIRNYHPDYRNENCNVFFILKHGRYAQGRGRYYVLEDQGCYVGSAGWNHYDNHTAILLSRAFVIPQYRTQYLLARHILPDQISQSQHYRHQWICSNDYNSAIYQWFARCQQGRRSSLFANWPDIYKKFQPIGQKNIYHTSQWVVQYQP